MAKIIDGKLIAQNLKEDLLVELSCFSARPTLAILHFKSPASDVYKSAQVSQALSLGIKTSDYGFSSGVSQQEVEQVIQRCNLDTSINGIFVHQPMPPQIDASRVSVAIDPLKDIEGIHPQNSARRFFSRARIGSCTALAVMRLIESTGVDISGKEAVVVGHSEIVGRPVSMLLLDRLATTTICHVGTSSAGKLQEHVRRAQILVVAVGKPRMIKGDWINKGSIVIDVGINVVDGRVVGDVDFEEAAKHADFISPVPGGVGPVTVMMVMKNTIEAFKLQRNI